MYSLGGILSDNVKKRVVDETFCCAQPKINFKAPSTIDSRIQLEIASAA